MSPVPKPRPRYATFLKAWRLYRNLTQDSAASRIGVDRTTLGRIERGLVPYNQAFLEAAADAYNCTPADLLMRDPKNPIWSLMDTIRNLSPDKQKTIAGIIKGFLDVA